MMKKYSILLLVSLLVIACGGGDDDTDDIIIKKDQIRIAPSQELLGDGEAKEMPISATCDWKITKDANADWLTVTPMSGTKDTRSIVVSAGKNSTGVNRTAILTISGGDAQTQRVVVTQLKSSDSQDPSTSGEPSAGDNLPPS